MKTIKINRLEGIYAICEDENQKYYAIEISELPEGASAGDVLKVDDTLGTLSIDHSAPATKKKGKK